MSLSTGRLLPPALHRAILHVSRTTTLGKRDWDAQESLKCAGGGIAESTMTVRRICARFGKNGESGGISRAVRTSTRSPLTAPAPELTGMTSFWDDHGVETLVQRRTISATLPVVFCAPHGGNAVDGDQAETLLERPEFVTEESNIANNSSSGRGARNINIVADTGTSQLVEEIDRRVARKCANDGEMGAAAAVVVARFHRKYVDANRSLDDASAVAVHPLCPRAKELHEKYHASVEEATTVGRVNSENQQQGQQGQQKRSLLLLLDIHGQHKFDEKVLIGTW